MRVLSHRVSRERLFEGLFEAAGEPAGQAGLAETDGDGLAGQAPPLLELPERGALRVGQLGV